MKTVSLLLLIVGLTGCHGMKSASKSSRTYPVTSVGESIERTREEKKRFLQTETEPRAKTYEKRGYSPEESRAIAEIEYLRAAR